MYRSALSPNIRSLVMPTGSTYTVAARAEPGQVEKGAAFPVGTCCSPVAMAAGGQVLGT